jgi:hypothetical protein
MSGWDCDQYFDLRRDLDAEYLAARVFDHEENVKHTEEYRFDAEEIARPDRGCVLF